MMKNALNNSRGFQLLWYKIAGNVLFRQWVVLMVLPLVVGPCLVQFDIHGWISRDGVAKSSGMLPWQQVPMFTTKSLVSNPCFSGWDTKTIRFAPYTWQIPISGVHFYLYSTVSTSHCKILVIWWEINAKCTTNITEINVLDAGNFI